MLVSDGGAGGSFMRGTVFAKESAGLTAAQAAPAPNSCANLRREIEMLFIYNLRLVVIRRSPANCETENWGVQAASLLFSAAGRKDSAKFNLLRPTYCRRPNYRRLQASSLRSPESGVQRRRRYHSQRRFWLRRVCRLQRRRVKDCRRRILLLFRLHRRGKGGVEHR